ncbi:gamma-butyrobetaine hydroxylase-like domain-containing protein [Xanthobacter sp. TB0139]|uniref:gamma-butyrobetaine hydroxylase-like domain-containing protein n=1 Tax=Xanthobacter sp. TB0139 TaxID=3459178 RepID=UPI00403A49BA
MPEQTSTDLWPTEVRLPEGRDALIISFENGARFELPAEYLRVESPSAEVQGHAPHEKKIVPGKRHVRISAVEPVGNYALRIVFDDGHNTGIYPWDTLHSYGLEQDKKFAAYLKALEERGLSRE